jgi:hypothetical protein
MSQGFVTEKVEAIEHGDPGRSRGLPRRERRRAGCRSIHPVIAVSAIAAFVVVATTGLGAARAATATARDGAAATGPLIITVAAQADTSGAPGTAAPTPPPAAAPAPNAAPPPPPAPPAPPPAAQPAPPPVAAPPAPAAPPPPAPPAAAQPAPPPANSAPAPSAPAAPPAAPAAPPATPPASSTGGN